MEGAVKEEGRKKELRKEREGAVYIGRDKLYRLQLMVIDYRLILQLPKPSDNRLQHIVIDYRGLFYDNRLQGVVIDYQTLKHGFFIKTNYFSPTKTYTFSINNENIQ